MAEHLPHLSGGRIDSYFGVMSGHNRASLLEIRLADSGICRCRRQPPAGECSLCGSSLKASKSPNPGTIIEYRSVLRNGHIAGESWNEGTNCRPQQSYRM